MSYAHRAIALKIGDRFFHRIGSKGQVLTAWHVAGAELFMDKASAIPTMAKLSEKKKKFEIIKVEVAA